MADPAGRVDLAGQAGFAGQTAEAGHSRVRLHICSYSTDPHCHSTPATNHTPAGVGTPWLAQVGRDIELVESVSLFDRTPLRVLTLESC